MNNEAPRLNVRGVSGVSFLRIPIDGNKKYVGEFIEFREQFGKCQQIVKLESRPLRFIQTQSSLLSFSTSANESRSPTSIIKSESGMKKHSQINNRIFAPESACNTIESCSVFVFAVHRKKSPYVTRH